MSYIHHSTCTSVTLDALGNSNIDVQDESLAPGNVFQKHHSKSDDVFHNELYVLIYFIFYYMFYQLLRVQCSGSSTQSLGSVLPSIVETRDQNSWGCPLLF